MKVGNFHRQRFRFQAIAAACIAIGNRLKLLNLLARPTAVGFFIATLKIGNDTFKRLFGFIAPQPVIIFKGNDLIARPVKNDLLGLFRQVVPNIAHFETIMARNGFQCLRVIGRGGFRPGRNRAFIKCQPAIGDNRNRVDEKLGAKPVARWACAKRIVEREQTWLNLFNGEARHRTGKTRGKNNACGFFIFFLIGHFGHGNAVGQAKRDLH